MWKDLMIALPNTISWDVFEDELKTMETKNRIKRIEVKGAVKDWHKVKDDNRLYVIHNGYFRGYLQLTGAVKHTQFKPDAEGKKQSQYFIEAGLPFIALPETEEYKGKGFPELRYRYIKADHFLYRKD